MSHRGKRKTEVGVVTSDSMQKTIAVKVERLVRHPKFGKVIRKYITFKAHDEKEEANAGDLVEITETRPLSKTKRYRLTKVLQRAEAFEELAPDSAGSAVKQPPPAPPQGETQL